MEETRKALCELFDEMLGNMRFFKKKTYEDFFKSAYDGHKDMIASLAGCAGEEGMTEEEIVEELASAIPEYAQKKMSEVPRRQREKAGIDYNLTMAVYIIPMLVYRHDERNDWIADRMVEIWNSWKVTGYPLTRSEFGQIAGGFKKGLCYITTAVCLSQGKADDCYELNTLRSYRDQYLMRTKEGRALVDEYYEIAPGIVFVIGMQKEPDRIYEEILKDYLMPCIRYVEEGEYEACKELYCRMVGRLRSRYLPEDMPKYS
jgi:hypothetical protein